jgi:hypothetical protein
MTSEATAEVGRNCTPRITQLFVAKALGENSTATSIAAGRSALTNRLMTSKPESFARGFSIFNFQFLSLDQVLYRLELRRVRRTHHLKKRHFKRALDRSCLRQPRKRNLFALERPRRDAIDNQVDIKAFGE